MTSVPAFRRTRADVLRDERGLTLVEVVVAAFLLVTVVVATFALLDTSTRSSFRAEESQTVINIAQRELEELRDLDYTKLAMSALPPAPYGMDIEDPTSRIRNSGADFCLDRVDGDDPCAAPTLSPLVVNGGPLEEGGTVTGGQVDPFTPDVQVGDITVDIYRFVVWQNEGGEPLASNDPICVEEPLDFRCKQDDYKRVVVAVKVQEAPISYERPYEEVHSDFIDPTRATLPADPLGPTEEVIGEQFWLSDTPCVDGPNEPARAAYEHHQTHDTTGTCSDANGKPDALLTSPPDDPRPDLTDVPGFFDYSTEIELNCGTVDCDLTDSGLQMLDQEGSCAAVPSDSNASDDLKQIHRWVSSPMPAGFDFVIEETATLKLSTRTIGGVPASGKVCAFLFERSSGVDTTLATGSITRNPWPAPTGAWADVEIVLDLTSPLLDHVPAGNRLGVSIAVDPSGTPDNVLEFLYDHPEGESRLEVLTTTPLP